MGEAKLRGDMVGRTATLYIERMSIQVIVCDIRSAFGRTDFLVSPERGDGQQWVSGERISNLQGWDDPAPGDGVSFDLWSNRC